MGNNEIPDGVWSLHRAADTLFLELDDVRILFQQAADKTHFLNQASAFILDFIAEQPAGFSSILQMLSADGDAQQTNSQTTQLMNHLIRLEQLGLVERRRSDH